jgi:hypothetical protein
MAVITVNTDIVHAMTSRDFYGWGQGGANLLPPLKKFAHRKYSTNLPDQSAGGTPRHAGS